MNIVSLNLNMKTKCGTRQRQVKRSKHDSRDQNSTNAKIVASVFRTDMRNSVTSNILSRYCLIPRVFKRKFKLLEVKKDKM